MNRTPASAFLRTARVAVAAVAVVALAPTVAGAVDGRGLVLPTELPGNVSDVLASVSSVTGLWSDDEATSLAIDTPGVAQRATTLMVKHDCWAGEAPEGASATHSVVTVRQGERLVTRYGGAALTERATSHVFQQADSGIFMVHGFCR